MSSISHDVASTIFTPERATDCHERWQWPWQALRFFFPPFFLDGVFFHAQSTPTAQIFANRTCAAQHMVWITRASPQNGRQAATGSGRGGGRRCRCQKKLRQLSLVLKAIELTPPRKKTKTAWSERHPRCSEWKRCARIGRRLPRMATEAVADVAHGWHGFCCCVCVLS